MKSLENQVGGSHYVSDSKKIEPLEFALQRNYGACEFSVLKYLDRHSRKNGAEDVKKALHYLQILLEHDYGEYIEIVWNEKKSLSPGDYRIIKDLENYDDEPEGYKYKNYNR